MALGERLIKMASCVFCSDNLKSVACFAAHDDDVYIGDDYGVNDDDGCNSVQMW